MRVKKGLRHRVPCLAAIDLLLHATLQIVPMRTPVATARWKGSKVRRRRTKVGRSGATIQTIARRAELLFQRLVP